MHLELVKSLFGTDHQWRGPCTVILDALATIQTSGADAIVHSGAKVFAPRLISGRLQAHSACFLPQQQVLVLVQNERIRQAGGEDLAQQTVVYVDLEHIAALEFHDSSTLANLGLNPPPTIF